SVVPIRARRLFRLVLGRGGCSHIPCNPASKERTTLLPLKGGLNQARASAAPSHTWGTDARDREIRPAELRASRCDNRHRSALRGLRATHRQPPGPLLARRLPNRQSG